MSSSEELRLPPDDPQSQAKAEEGTSQETTTKKKKFKPFKALKNLFAGKKRSKAKDGDAAPRAWSAESVLQAEGGEQSSLSKKHSMSDDSVFSSGKTRDINPGELVKSMEALPHAAEFQNELARKIRHRREDKEDFDDGLPQSPLSYTTLDALEDNKHKGNNMSGYGDSSMNSEVGDDFFRPMASGSSLKPGNQSDPGSDVDLDAIPQGSTTNLANSYAYHKLAVKPKKPGRTSRSPVSTIGLATSPAQGGLQVLPLVTEEKKMLKEDDTPDEGYDMDTSTEEPLGENKIVISNKLHRESQANVEQDVFVIEKEKGVSVKVEASVKKAEGTKEELEKSESEVAEVETSKAEVKTSKTEVETSKAEAEIEINKAEVETSTAEVERTKTDKEMIIVKTSPKILHRNIDQSPNQGNNSEKNSEVVMRKNKKASSELDMSKRQTIATETEVTPFGERRKRASLIVETKKWVNLDQQKENEEEEVVSSGNSEFAKMFNKFQRKSLKKTHSPEEEENVAKHLVFPSRSSIKTDRTPTTLSSVENKYNPKTNNKFSSEGQKKSVDPPVKAPSSQVLIDKTAEVEQKNSGSSKKIVVKKTVSINDNVDKTAKLNQSPPIISSTGQSTKPVTIELSKTVKSDSRGSVAPASSEHVVRKNEKDTGKGVKEITMAHVNDKDTKSSESFKRDSPRIRNRDRSQTLPEQSVPKDIITVESLPSVKRTASSVTAKETKKEVVVTPKLSSPIKSGSKRPEPKKLHMPENSSGGGPSWIAMARKKTTGWSEETDKEIEKKETKSGLVVADTEANYLDSCSDEAKGAHRKSVMDMAKKFQKLPVS